MTRYYCDFCDKQVDGPNRLYEERVDVAGPQRRWYLCSSCANGLVDLLRGAPTDWPGVVLRKRGTHPAQ